MSLLGRAADDAQSTPFTRVLTTGRDGAAVPGGLGKGSVSCSHVLASPPFWGPRVPSLEDQRSSRFTIGFDGSSHLDAVPHVAAPTRRPFPL